MRKLLLAGLAGVLVATATPGHAREWQDADLDHVLVCEHVTGGGEVPEHCGAPTTYSVPPPVQNVVQAFKPMRSTCATFATQSHSAADQPPAFDIRTDGDVYVGDEWAWDCPPYGTSGS